MSAPTRPEDTRPRWQRGPLAWMAANPVAANLLMVMLVVGGLLIGDRAIKQEVFPEFDLDVVRIEVPYPGASPAEIEESVLEVIEEAVRGLDGTKKVTSGALEGVGSVTVQLLEGADPNKSLADIKNAVDRITSFPQEIEEPVVSLMVNRRQVISLVVHGEVDRRALKEIAEQARDELLADPRITQVELDGLPPLEIAIEVPQEVLRAHGLTLEQIAAVVRAGALELPGGGVKTDGGEVLVRTAERADFGREFEAITVLSNATGTRLSLGDLATVRDHFADTDQAAYFNGEPAVMIRVFRVGDETPIAVAAAAKEIAQRFESRLTDGVAVATWMDDSEVLAERIDLLMRNAQLGLLLVLIVLGLFLNMRLAFWVTLGIPISFAGSLVLLPAWGVSINMISLFAFIISLGMVVDDAIVVGEAIFARRKRGVSFLRAAVEGVREVSVPVTFSILTSIAAFSPMLLVPGISGKLFGVIPAIVITVLLISLVESLFILPAHLSHGERRRERGLLAQIGDGFRLLLLPLWPLKRGFELLNGATNRALDWNIRRVYAPFLRLSLRWRYATLALAAGTFHVAVGVMAGGRVDFTFMPKIEGDLVTAKLVLPYGSPVERTESAQARLVAAAEEVLDDLGGSELSRGIYTNLGRPPAPRGPVNLQLGVPGGHQASVEVRLVPLAERDFSAAAFAERWRERVGPIAGAEMLAFDFALGASVGAPVTVQLSHRDLAVLERAAASVAEALETYPGVKDIDDGFQLGKPQLDFEVTEHGRSLGITPAILASQLRSAFYGAEALRQQRGRDEVKVMVRLPEAGRSSEYHIEELMLRTPTGGEVPLAAAATLTRGRAYTSIARESGRRAIQVTADIEPGRTSSEKVLASLQADVLPGVLAASPGLQASFEGERAEQRDALGSLGVGYLLALIIIYALLAIPFRSYAQPLVVMSAIPLGFVGALIGHIIMGFDLSIISMMGVIALSGVVVNDSLVLVAAANRFRAKGMSARDAIAAAGKRRYRPILLTSLTTFFGLAPMIFETSVQARFLIPMAISLGFGILFATVIILVVVPSAYLVVEDLKRLLGVGEYARTPQTDADPADVGAMDPAASAST